MSTFHAGEIAVQKRAGESHIAARNGRIISDTILPGAKPFLAEQRMLIAGSVSSDGSVWASAVFGEPGFARAEGSHAIRIDRKRVFTDAGDPLWSNLDRPVGLLFIDLATRKRYRVNGAATVEEDSVRIAVREAYPNCPKYISRRILSFNGSPQHQVKTDLIATTDVFFVASAEESHGTDVSHRGGPSGFVKVLDEKTLHIPDYAGNGMFNTLGNLAANPHAGLLFPDFPNGYALQLTGRAEIDWGAGSERSWLFHIDQSLVRPLPGGLREEWIDFSPYNPE